MLKQLEEFGKYVEITGFRGVKIKDIKAFADAVSSELPNGVEVQFFNADLVSSWTHLNFAIINALLAFQTGRNISKSIAVESVLYASAQRQIKKAIEQIGLKPGSERAALLVIGGDANSVKVGFKAVSQRLGMEPDETVLELSETKVKRIKNEFDISDAELQVVSSKSNLDQALVDLVIERVALLSTRL
jgi:tRNA threonylcarbamoyladenosine modification (KEOPS) complex Cgi121 subunit